MRNLSATLPPITQSSLSPQTLPNGSVLSVPVGAVTHYGIVCWNVARTRLAVVSNSLRAGGVIEQSFRDFTGGKRATSLGFPGSRPAWQVLRWAKSRVGQPYHLVTSNCEHFWREAHGLSRRSPQLARAALLAAGAALICASR